jgi:hypothetical protein
MKRLAALIGSASLLSVAIGSVYLVDCRRHARGLDQIDRCYLTSLPLMGIGTAGAGAFRIGYNTFNPALRKKEEGEG